MVRVDWVRSQIEALAAVRGRPDQMKTRKRRHTRHHTGGMVDVGGNDERDTSPIVTTRQIIGKRAEVTTRATLEKHDNTRTTPKSRWAAGAWDVYMKHLSGATLGTIHPQPQARRCHPKGGVMSRG